MDPTRPLTRRLPLVVSWVMFGIAALAVLLGRVPYSLGPYVFVIFVSIHVFTIFVTRPSNLRGIARREVRHFRFSIWHVMMVSVAAAVFCAIVRAVAVVLISQNPQRGLRGPWPVVGMSLILVLSGLPALGGMFVVCRSLMGLFLLGLRVGRKDEPRIELSRDVLIGSASRPLASDLVDQRLVREADPKKTGLSSDESVEF